MVQALTVESLSTCTVLNYNSAGTQGLTMSQVSNNQVLPYLHQRCFTTPADAFFSVVLGTSFSEAHTLQANKSFCLDAAK